MMHDTAFVCTLKHVVYIYTFVYFLETSMHFCNPLVHDKKSFSLVDNNSLLD